MEEQYDRSGAFSARRTRVADFSKAGRCGLVSTYYVMLRIARRALNTRGTLSSDANISGYFSFPYTVQRTVVRIAVIHQGELSINCALEQLLPFRELARRKAKDLRHL
jgi:hypothetical protein